MTHAVGLRATSFAASAALLGLAAIAALSMSITLRRTEPPDLPAASIIAERPPEPPAPAPAVSTPPASPGADEAPVVQTVAPHEQAPPRDYAGLAALPPAPPLILSPHWLRQPMNLARYYPRRALQMEIEGEVLLDCLVTADGRLRCGVLSETPVNWGFAAAALRIAGDHRMVPAYRDGVPVEGRYRMRIPFEVE